MPGRVDYFMMVRTNVAAPSLPFDDSYISFAYAAHLVEGNGLRLSVGSPPVEAFSDPLWVVLMAAGKAIGFGIVTWARIVNAVLIAVLAVTTARFVRRLNPRAPRWMAVLAAASVALVPAVPYQAIGGPETLLFAVLLNCVLLAVLTDRLAGRPVSVTTTGLCFLAFLTRPEGLVLWVLVWSVSWTWVRAFRGQLVAAAWFVVPTVVVEVARLDYFHQWLTNSIVAKSGMSFSTSAHLVWVEVSTFAGEYPPLLVALAGVCIGTLVLRRWRTPITMVLVIVLGLALFKVPLSAGANYPYERYLLPLLAAATAVVVAAFGRLGWGGSVARHVQRVRYRGLSLVRLRYVSGGDVGGGDVGGGDVGGGLHQSRAGDNDWPHAQREPRRLPVAGIVRPVWGAPTTSTTTVELGTDPAARTDSLDLPASGYYLLQLAPGPSFSISTAQWAEPRIECGPPG
jgi:hypothetical protein